MIGCHGDVYGGSIYSFVEDDVVVAGAVVVVVAVVIDDLDASRVKIEDTHGVTIAEIVVEQTILMSYSVVGGYTKHATLFLGITDVVDIFTIFIFIFFCR